MTVRWTPQITAKVVGSRAYQTFRPWDAIDQGSAVNCGYWTEHMLDQLHADGARIVRIEIQGTEE